MADDINHDILISIIAGSMLFFLLCIFIVAFTLLYFKKRRQNKQKLEKLASKFAATLLQSELEIKEQTLQNIAHELHDNLGHTASLIKIYLNTINTDNQTNANKKIAETKELIKQLIRDLKLLSLDLNSDRIIRLGLSMALTNEVEKLNKIDTLSSSIRIKGNEFILTPEKTIILYRMSQEIITNVIKHSHASEVLLKLIFLENLLTLVFHDNGLGFDVPEKMNGDGNGLINLENRATVINAKLNIQSTTGMGTTITIQISK